MRGCDPTSTDAIFSSRWGAALLFSFFGNDFLAQTFFPRRLPLKSPSGPEDLPVAYPDGEVRSFGAVSAPSGVRREARRDGVSGDAGIGECGQPLGPGNGRL